MKLLLYTHIILWALDDNPKLPEQAKVLIMNAGNDVYYSSASVWKRQSNICQSRIKSDSVVLNYRNFAEKWGIRCCQLQISM